MTMQEQPDPELRMLVASNDLDDYDILAINTISAAVPHETTESFRKMIWGAMTTYALGNSSIDHVLKQYNHVWERFRVHAFERDPQIIALRKMVAIVDKIAEAVQSQPIQRSTGQVCAKAALCRLEATFKAAYGLIRREYIFEVDALSRLVLEQIAWSRVAFSKNDNSVFSLNPTKCISELKAFYPSAGRLYGELSAWAHISPDIAANYVHFHNAGISVVKRSPQNSAAAGRRLLELSVLYATACSDLFALREGNDYAHWSSELEGLCRSYEDSGATPAA